MVHNNQLCNISKRMYTILKFEATLPPYFFEYSSKNLKYSDSTDVIYGLC